MTILNRYTKKYEDVELNDILYTYYEGESNGREKRQTWTFNCCGLIKFKDETYIISPGDQLFTLGIDCFTNLIDCWAIMRLKNKPEIGDRYKVIFEKVKPEEQIKI